MPSSSTKRFPLACDARVKLAVAGLAWLLVLAASHPATSLALGAFAGVSLTSARVPLGRVLRPLLGAAFTAVVAVILRVLVTSGPPLLELGLFGHALTISREGLRQGGVLGARVLGALAVGAWLTATSLPGELLAALAWFRVPPQLLDILALAARYVWVLRETLETGKSAQTLRLGYRDFRSSLRCAGVLMGLVVGRALEQAIVTGQAMQLRGCGAELGRSSGSPPSRGNLRLVCLSLVASSVSIALSRTLSW